VNSPRNVVSCDRGALLELFRKGVAGYASFEASVVAVR
jgi:hypothetical protein